MLLDQGVGYDSMIMRIQPTQSVREAQPPQEAGARWAVEAWLVMLRQLMCLMVEDINQLNCLIACLAI